MRLRVCLIGLLVGLFVGLCVVSPAAFAEPMDYSFTYQGQLQDDGSPANGLHNFRVTPVDEFGVDLGPMVVLVNVNVVDGLFTLDLDFGDALLTTEKVYLKIFVGASGGESVELLPHTLLRSSPFAIQAQEAVFSNVADTSLDNEFTRSGNNLFLGNTSEKLLFNPGLSGNSFADPSTIFQVNLGDYPGLTGMVVNAPDTKGVPFYGFALGGVPYSRIEAQPWLEGMFFQFNSEASPSFIIKPTHSTTNRFIADEIVVGDLEVVDQIRTDGGVLVDYDSSAATESYHHAVPIAFGTYHFDGTLLSGTSNLSSAVWNSTGEWWMVTIDGVVFDDTKYTVSVTPRTLFPSFTTATSGFGDIQVHHFDLSGNRLQSRFQIIVYEGAEVVMP